MEQRKRIYIFLTFFLCTACLTLLTASLATHRWIVAYPVRSIASLNASFRFDPNLGYDTRQTMPTAQGHNRTSAGDFDFVHNQLDSKKFRGEIYFGLFQGTKVLNYGLGDRTTIIWLKQEMSRNPHLMSFTLWLLTILSVSIAMIFGLVGAIFAIINTVMTPIETITGVQGLFLWNGLATLFSACAAACWLTQFFGALRANVLTEDEQHDGWTSANRAALGYCYYFVLISGVLHLANIALIYAATRPPRRHIRAVIDKHPEGLIMLY